MNGVNEASPASKTSDVERVVMHDMKPNGYARSWLYKQKAKSFRLEFDSEDWCSVFNGKRKVWQCNGVFARAHFSA